METNLWGKYSEEEKNQVMEFCEGYRSFLSACKTERECVHYAVKEAEKHGFRSVDSILEEKGFLSAGDKVYAVNMDKSVVLFVLGSEPMENGLNIVGAHIDSPRIDLKANPFFESEGFCMLDTHYYGGIKKYQWIALPLALHGVVCKTDGTTENIVFGEGDDPVLGISDLLPHLDKDDKKDIKGEDLNILGGNMADEKAEKKKFTQFILNMLKEKGITEEDFFSSEIEIVPAGNARNFGLDNSMIMAYGHDDRVCAYTGLQALFEIENPKQTAVNILVDKEEIGSVGATGMHSKFFENILAEIMNLRGEYSELGMRRCLARSNMLSSDVTAAVDPNYLTPFNLLTDAEFAKGISFNKFTGSRGKSGANDANPEFIAKIRKCLDEAKVTYQATEMGKVDQGGGGTIAYIMAKYGMNVIDAGVPVLNMHAPWEIVSKADVYEAYKCYKAFYKI